MSPHTQLDRALLHITTCTASELWSINHSPRSWEGVGFLIIFPSSQQNVQGNNFLLGTRFAQVMKQIHEHNVKNMLTKIKYFIRSIIVLKLRKWRHSKYNNWYNKHIIRLLKMGVVSTILWKIIQFPTYVAQNIYMTVSFKLNQYINTQNIYVIVSFELNQYINYLLRNVK